MNKFKLGDWAHIAEIIACVMVIVSIVYAVFEYNRDAEVDTATLIVDNYNRLTDLQRLMVENAELAEIVVRAKQNPDTLSATDRYRFLQIELSYYNAWEILYIYQQQGRLDEYMWMPWNEWYSMDASARPLFGWVENRHNFMSPGFKALVDEAVGYSPNNE